MLKKIRSAISIILVTTLLFNISFSITNATDSTTNKISEELKNKMTDMNEADNISIIAWFEDIDLDSINAKAEKALGYTQEDIQTAEAAIPSIDENVFALEGAAYTNALKNYEEETREERTIVSNMQNDLVFTQRQLAKTAYMNYNTNKESLLNIDTKNVDYISQFSPTVFLTVTKKQIEELSNNDNIVLLSYCSNLTVDEEFSYALPALDIPYTRDFLGLDGTGVNIGMYDGGQVGTHSELNSSNITKIDPSNATVSPHATTVARIMAGSNGVVPNVNLYSTSTDSIYVAIEELIAEGVSVINMSLAVSAGERETSYYTGIEQWVDHIAYQHNVTLVKSAGNNGITETVTEPGLAYNIITVGGTDTQNTTNINDDTLYAGSCSGNGGREGCAKPDFLAPARINNGFGTSYAAPIVTGIIAQMIDYKPSIATNPALIKAILTASTDKKVLPGNNGSTEVWETTITAQQGAGQVNAQRAIHILTNNKYATGTMSSGTVSKTFSDSLSGNYIRCAISWIRNNTTTSHQSGTSTASVAPNLRLHIYDPNGTSVGSSNITTSSVELVHFTVSTSGTYTAKITRMDSGTNSFRYAIAWY